MTSQARRAPVLFMQHKGVTSFECAISVDSNFIDPNHKCCRSFVRVSQMCLTLDYWLNIRIVLVAAAGISWQAGSFRALMRRRSSKFLSGRCIVYVGLHVASLAGCVLTQAGRRAGRDTWSGCRTNTMTSHGAAYKWSLNIYRRKLAPRCLLAACFSIKIHNLQCDLSLLLCCVKAKL